MSQEGWKSCSALLSLRPMRHACWDLRATKVAKGGRALALQRLRHPPPLQPGESYQASICDVKRYENMQGLHADAVLTRSTDYPTFSHSIMAIGLWRGT
mmetsp:Transcript_77346/g.121852  ORF Transcript_77346/g.121852 Transcript_77346/m.121852 type:complete len:99 (-) Transcript_77346:48-344(-)